MARIVKEHAVRRNEILDVAQRLVYTKGYEQMAIQDILNELQIAKGTVYHYFDSKQALLEALIERMQGEVEQLLLPLVHDPALSALDKLQRFFATINQQNSAQKSLALAFMRVWYTDDNAIARQKMHTTRVKRVTPWLTTIISQGVQEGSLTTAYPDQVGRVILSLLDDLVDTLAGLLLSDDPKQNDLSQAERIVAATTCAITLLLGLSSDALQLADTETLKVWFVEAQDNA
ncbi:TetR/AcrR family transcriptional regulator [Ktedonobacter racemifer]|uniref:Transcriptional regulator, TetR family n=1 Tax=Ktedonobacter racemifer DSM 44963 TaxID=485913 RepID=D6TUD1_KTERA|nr:TetR/AcrR family transcriptional regulator [Ktedonobacter racemifer]EFH85228.1 transcriptional regulator, TetR family [Ktedonobacter racemifer DSM 44963]